MGKPRLREFGYDIVMAGVLQKQWAEPAVYVKYKRDLTDKLYVKAEASNFVWYDCPDREVLITIDNHTTDPFYPSGESFDEFQTFNLFEEETAKLFGINFIMTNYAHDPYSTNNRKFIKDKKLHILSDSGGLQLARGVKSNINPKDLALYYNNNVDAGMVLDYPIWVSGKEAIIKSGKKQKASIDTMLDYCNVDLINILHGQTKKDREIHRKLVETPAIKKVALGGISNSNPIKLASIIIETIEGGQQYEQYHILGTFKSSLIPVLISIANTYKVLITSDSSTHKQEALNKKLMSRPNLDANISSRMIGREVLESPYNRLPCSCPVCSLVRYTDILGKERSRTSTVLLATHNIHEVANSARMLQDFFIKGVLKKHVKQNYKGKIVLDSLDFVEYAKEFGLNKACIKYKYYLQENLINPEIFPTRETPHIMKVLS